LQIELEVQHSIVVVSPLKSLMLDQVQGCERRGIRAKALHGETENEEKNGE
jgi:superfamily II DNA helicase RecQ